MWSGRIEIRHIGFDHPLQLLLVEYQHVIQTLTSDTPQEAFTDRIRFGCTYRRAHNVNAAGSPRERSTVLAVVVTDQETRARVERCRFPELLGNPCVARGASDGKMNDAAGTQLDDEEDEAGAKPQVVGLNEIARPNVLCVIVQKGSPGLSTFPGWSGRTNLPDVLGNGALTERIAQLAEFIANAFDAPQTIVERHRVDQVDHVLGNARWPRFRPRLLSPE